MRYMDLWSTGRLSHLMCVWVIHIRSMDVGGYKHNYEGFYKKTSYQMSINRGRTITIEGAHASLVGILFILLFLSW